MLIKNARVITHGNNFVLKDILIQNDKISKIENIINVDDTNVKIIDLKGLYYVIPGVIDCHVHMRTPGLSHKEDFYSGSLACAKGGVTTFIDMPNTIPTTTTVNNLNLKRDLASKTSVVNYGFHFGGSNYDNSNEIPKLNIASTKVFMNVSTGKMLVEDNDTLENIFSKSKLITVHGENEMVEKSINISNKCSTPLHLCHISSKDELKTIEKYKSTSNFTVEVTPHHLFLNEDDLKNNPLLRMKPELKSNLDCNYLWDCINNGIIDTLGSDHAPHLLNEKLENLTFGVGGVETSLPLMLNSVNQNKLTMEKLISLMCNNPSQIFNIEKRGFLKKDFCADLVIVDLNKPFKITNDTIVSKCKWTPFHNFSGFGDVLTTIVNGNIVFNDNVFFNNTGREINYE